MHAINASLFVLDLYIFHFITAAKIIISFSFHPPLQYLSSCQSLPNACELYLFDLGFGLRPDYWNRNCRKHVPKDCWCSSNSANAHYAPTPTAGWWFSSTSTSMTFPNEICPALPLHPLCANPWVSVPRSASHTKLSFCLLLPIGPSERVLFPPQWGRRQPD